MWFKVCQHVARDAEKTASGFLKSHVVQEYRASKWIVSCFRLRLFEITCGSRALYLSFGFPPRSASGFLKSHVVQGERRPKKGWRETRLRLFEITCGSSTSRSLSIVIRIPPQAF